MLIKEISKIIGNYLFFLALALLVPLGVAIYFDYFASPELYPQPHSTFAFLETLAICIFVASVFSFWGRKSSGVIFRREGLIIVVLIWFITAVIGGLPFLLSKTLDNPIDAYFEAMSGLTTTGATVMQSKKYDPITNIEVPIVSKSFTTPIKSYTYYGTIKPVIDKATGIVIFSGVEAVSRAILFWRSFLQWLGGMGIVVLFIAILPAFGVGGKVLFQTEAPGPTTESITPRIKETASLLWKTYLILTGLQVLLLTTISDDLPFFDAITITFSTISTGGFSVQNSSIGTYHSNSIEWIIIFFMLFGSINFTLYFHLIKGKLFRLFEPEFLTYLVVVIVGSLVIAVNLRGSTSFGFDGVTNNYTMARSIRHGAFEFVSSVSSTGFSTANYTLWPFLSQSIMLIAMFIGGMSGSTAGGIKIVRHILFCKMSLHKMESIYRPDAVRKIRFGNKEVSRTVSETVLSFFFIVIALSIVATLLYISDGIDPATSLTLTGCMINNVGETFGVATNSCAFMSAFSKILSTLWMVLGRLEFFAILILFIPAFWKDN